MSAGREDLVLPRWQSQSGAIMLYSVGFAIMFMVWGQGNRVKARKVTKVFLLLFLQKKKTLTFVFRSPDCPRFEATPPQTILY